MSQISIYHGGDIITMEKNSPFVEAVAVQNGNILAIGTLESLENLAKTNAMAGDTRKINLHGKTLIPAFFDPHTHLCLVAMSFATAYLRPPPLGTVDSIDKLVQTLRDFITDRKVAPGQWVIGNEYDENGMIEGRHPTRRDLDQVSEVIPIFIQNATVHCAVANSVALKMMNIDESTPDPEGGTIYREDGTNIPNGILEEENAFKIIFDKLPAEAYGMTTECFRKSLEAYASFGTLTTQEPGTDVPGCLRILSDMSRDLVHGVPAVDSMLYARPDQTSLIAENAEYAGLKYKNHVRLGGIKVILDGAIQGYTAYLSKPYHVCPTDKEPGWAGYPTFPNQADVDQLVEKCFRNHWHLLAHANGDAAADQLISGVKRAISILPANLTTDHRTTIIHGQTLRDDQLDEIARLGIYISFFTNHTYYWGDFHITKYLGPQRSNRMNPVRNAINRGIPFTIHNDATVTPMSIIDVMYFSTNRYTQSGIHMGPEQELTVEEALQGVTINGARQHFEEDKKGSIKVGKYADFTILSENPLKMDKKRLREVQVLETIKNGVTVFQKENSQKSNE